MAVTLDYGRSESPMSRAMRLLVRILVGGVILVGCYITLIFVVMTPWGRDLTTPRVGRLVQDETGIALPESFVQTGRAIHGGLDPAGYFAGKIASGDIASFVTTLERSLLLRDRSDETIRPIDPPPAWWTPATWPRRRTFERGGPPNLTVIHINPQTGDIAIEWVTT